MKIKEFWERVFHVRVIFLYDGEPKDVEQYVKKRFKEDITLSGFDGMAFRCDKNEMKWYIVWIRKRSSYYTLTHETTHMVEWIFKDRGIDFTGEPVAYYLEHWVRVFWKEVSKKRKRKK